MKELLAKNFQKNHLSDPYALKKRNQILSLNQSNALNQHMTSKDPLAKNIPSAARKIVPIKEEL